MNYILVENKKKYIEPFMFVPIEIWKYGNLRKPIWNDEIEYIDFHPSNEYAYKEQLQKFIQETNTHIDNTYMGNSHCGIQNLPRNEMLKRYVPEGNCPFINQTIKSIKNYLKKNNLCFNEFISVYPTHKIIFDADISNYDKIQYISNKYDEIEKNISRMRYYKIK